MPLFELEDQIASAFPPKKWLGVRTLIAVSGGPDSIALLRAMLNIGTRMAKNEDSSNQPNLIVGHVNHRMRSSESNEDVQFVRTLSAKLDLEFHLANPNSQDVPRGASEESLRNFRYDQLLNLAQQVGARYLVTGHNFDDQVETILFRILRGTGINGLAGIPAQRLANDSVTIVRPLINVKRSEIENYLQALDQHFRVDASNADGTYTRNYLRNELIPILEQRFGASVADSISRLGQQAAQLNLFLEQGTRVLDAAIIQESNECVSVDCSLLQSYDPVLVRSWISQLWARQNWPRQAMTFSWWQKIADSILENGDRILNLPGSIRFERSGNQATFSLANRKD